MLHSPNNGGWSAPPWVGGGGIYLTNVLILWGTEPNGNSTSSKRLGVVSYVWLLEGRQSLGMFRSITGWRDMQVRVARVSPALIWVMREEELWKIVLREPTRNRQ